MKTNTVGFSSEGGDAVMIESMTDDDTDLYYGIKPHEFLSIDEQNMAYRIMNANPEKIIILGGCQHKGKKDRHHPDYDKPFEVELLCKKCHFAKHKDQVGEAFNTPFGKNDLRRIYLSTIRQRKRYERNNNQDAEGV